MVTYSSGRKSPPSIREALDDIGQMSVAELSEYYERIFGEPARSSNKNYLQKHVSFRVQELAEGGLSKSTCDHLRSLVEGAPLTWQPWLGKGIEAPTAKPKRDPRLPAVGTLLVREWKGVQCEVIVREHDFEYLGRCYSTLSRVAKEITGSQWNGYTFFGLQDYKGCTSYKERVRR